MARNKHPEETIAKILTVSQQLFSEHGYERTTIADIVAATGMSKGAFYHHFKSKEDVYDRICNAYYDKQDWMKDATKFPGENALEKIRGLFSFLLSDPEKLALDKLGGGNADVLLCNPKIVSLMLLSSIKDASPVLETLIREGNADGSLHVVQPKETSEAFMLLMNMWIGVFVGDKDDFIAKMNFLKSFTDAVGLPLLDVNLIAVALHYYDAVMIHFKTLNG